MGRAYAEVSPARPAEGGLTMERLSDRAIEIINELHRERLDYESEYLPLIDCANKCQAYEDTGLEPEEIKQVFTEETVLKVAGQLLGITPDRLRELAQADREGRCVVLNMPRKPLVWGDDDQNTCLCPYCGRDLMGIPYGERMVLQCPECGQYLDVTKIITRAEAETALREDTDEH